MFKCAIIGVSGYGNIHLSNLLRECRKRRVELSAAAIINQEEEEEKCQMLKNMGCHIYKDYRKMLEDYSGSLDLVCIPTGINSHATMAEAAMQAGAHALIEKPAAATIQQIDSMRKMEKLSNRNVFVGFQHIYQDALLKAKKLILSGDIGKLRTARGICLWARTQDYYKRNKWSGRLRYGDEWTLDSPFNNATAHFLNVLLFLAGENITRSADISECHAELYRANKIQAPDSAVLHFKTPDGVDISYCCSHAIRNNSGPDLEFICKKGKLTVDFDGITAKSYDGERWNVGKWDARDDQSVKVFDAVLNRLDGGDDFVCDLKIAGQHTLAVNAAHDSTKITEIPSKYIGTYMYQGTQKVFYVENMDKILSMCFKNNQMPSRYNSDWGRKSQCMLLENYTEFKGNCV